MISDPSGFEALLDGAPMLTTSSFRWEYTTPAQNQNNHHSPEACFIDPYINQSGQNMK
jgi:hypothetical protein